MGDEDPGGVQAGTVCFGVIWVGGRRGSTPDASPRWRVRAVFGM